MASDVWQMTCYFCGTSFEEPASCDPAIPCPGCGVEYGWLSGIGPTIAGAKIAVAKAVTTEREALAKELAEAVGVSRDSMAAATDQIYKQVLIWIDRQRIRQKIADDVARELSSEEPT